MAADGYYRDTPVLSRKDPLTRWSWIFLGAAIVATLWMLLLMWLMAEELLADPDTALGLEQATWIGITTLIVAASAMGLFFVIVARLGVTSAGSYLSADLELAKTAAVAKAPKATAPTDAATVETPPPPSPAMIATAARIDDPFGPGGRMLLSYTFPETQPRGIYGDTYVLVDNDAVLNVKTLLARTQGR